MDLVASYNSDSDDSSQEHGLSSKVSSEAVKSENTADVDYFNLESSSSDDDECGNFKDNQQSLRDMALILTDKPYNPERPNSDHLNSGWNSKESEILDFSYSKQPIMATIQKDIVDVNSEWTEKNRSICNTFTVQEPVCRISPDCNLKNFACNMSINDVELTVPSKKLKTSHCSGNLNNGDHFYSVQTKYCRTENNLLESVEKKASFSACKQAKNCYAKSLPSGLPKNRVKTFSGHTGAISALRWCVPNYSHLLLSASLDSSLKVWDIQSKKMVQDIGPLSSGIKAAQWMSCGTAVICGGFGRKAEIFDIHSGKELMSYNFSSYVYSIEMHPVSQHLFVAGVKDKVLAFDTRNKSYEPIRKFESRCGQILDIKFLENGSEFVCSTEIVSSDSADRTIMVWDFISGAQLSNQIFQERYTCPFLQVDPSYRSFVAQTNGNYIAIFSAKRPYKMNKNKRYEGHKVSGYPISCDFSANGKYLASGDAEGSFFIFWNRSADLIKRQDVKPGVPITQVKWHPYRHSVVATSSWDGEVQLWQ